MTEQERRELRGFIAQTIGVRERRVYEFALIGFLLGAILGYTL